MRGIHHCNPATPPTPVRMVKVSLSFKTRSAKSCVVVVQIFPIIGNCTSTTGPAERSFSISAAGLRKYAWFTKSARMIAPCTCSSLTGGLRDCGYFVRPTPCLIGCPVGGGFGSIAASIDCGCALDVVGHHSDMVLGRECEQPQVAAAPCEERNAQGAVVQCAERQRHLRKAGETG